MKCIEVKDLTYSYNESTPVLKGISFDIEVGEYVSIVGHNGCGKSTLCKLLIGLLEKNSGSIVINGLELNSDNLTKIRSKIATVFQNPDNQFIGATVEDDIAFSLENMSTPLSEMVEKVKEAASKVGMSDYLTKEPSYLSGGQKQRVAIADALVREPEILILDEATSMLDPSGKKEILDLISQMRKENPSLTVISITHDIEESYNSDRIILLDEGQLVLSCSPSELFDNRELIEKYNLTVPFVVELKFKLEELGYKFDKNPSLEDIGEKLWQSK